MISTVTTSTVSTATATAVTASLAVIGILVLLALLIQKEIFSSSEKKQALRYSQALNIALPPMVIAFILIVAARVVQVLQ